MGRYVSIPIESAVFYGIRDVKPGYGTGGFRFYGVSGTFVVPAGVNEVRVTALGGGGSGGTYGNSSGQSWTGSGGGGGGYVVATIPVAVGCTCNVGVGGAGGGTSCFSTIVYAYGGCSGGSSCGSAGGAGGNFCVCTGGTCVVGRCGNCGCCGNSNSGSGVRSYSRDVGRGGASGSPIGGGGTGPWPGTSGQDVYNCKGFNGEDSSEADLASKFGNTIRWPGEAILGTSRTASVISGTAANYPETTYCVSAFGGGGQHSVCCGAGTIAYSSAGYGGGAGTCSHNCYCFNDFGYGQCACWQACGCFCNCRGCAGSGFVVVEY